MCTLNNSTSQSIQAIKLIDVCLEWINDYILYHHNSTTTQAIFKQKRLAWPPEYVGSQNVKITGRENAY